MSKEQSLHAKANPKKVTCMHVKEKTIMPSIMKEAYTKKSNKMDELEMQNKTNR